MAGSGRGSSEEQTPRSGESQRPPVRREEKETDVDRRAGKTLLRGLLRRPAQAVRRENCRYRRKTRPEEERRASLVLQSTPKAKTHEIFRGSTLTSLRLREPPIYTRDK